MSHAKGFFGTCDGNWTNHGRPSEGIQQQKCSKCGLLRNKKVSKCWFFHDYEDKGKPDFGKQKQVCSKCGDKRVRQVRPCFLFHKAGKRTRKNTEIRCVKCGSVLIDRNREEEYVG